MKRSHNGQAHSTLKLIPPQMVRGASRGARKMMKRSHIKKVRAGNLPHRILDNCYNQPLTPH